MVSYKAGIPTGKKCEKCGQGELLERISRHGFFLGCSRYPDAISSQDLSEHGSADVEEGGTRLLRQLRQGNGHQARTLWHFPGVHRLSELQDHAAAGERNEEGAAAGRSDRRKMSRLDGGRLIRGAGRYGDFIGCQNYPKCKYTRPITLGIKCPKCNEGEFVRRGTAKGRGARAHFLWLQPLSRLRFHDPARADCRAVPEVRRAVHRREADQARQFPHVHQRKVRLGSRRAGARTIRPSARAACSEPSGRGRAVEALVTPPE